MEIKHMPNRRDLDWVKVVAEMLLTGVNPEKAAEMLPLAVKIADDDVRAIVADLIFRRAMSKEYPLQNVSELGKFYPVIRTFDELKDRIEKLTQRRGSKGELARTLGIGAAQLSQWLNTERKPGADFTLQLLAWVQAEEAKQKSPASAETPAGQQTRSKHNDYEASKSSPPEP